MSCASLYFPSQTNRRTLGRYSKASGLALLLGCPAQIVSSFSCNLSENTLPYTIAPSLPFPIGNASFQYCAGRSYHNICGADITDSDGSTNKAMIIAIFLYVIFMVVWD